MTVTGKLVSERVREYRQELNQRPALSSDERTALIDAYEKRLIDEATAPLLALSAKIKADKEAEQRAVQAERDARDKAMREAKTAALKIQLESAWLRGGGEPEAFEKAWPELQREHLSKLTLEGRDEAREQHARRTHNIY